MKQHDVIIAGGGPTGLMLAAELRLAGVDVAIVEPRRDQTLAGSRAGGLQARSLEVLDQRGVVGRFLAEGKPMQTGMFAGVPIDIADFPTRHNHGLALFQNHIERILAGWVDELGATWYRGADVADFSQDDDGVTLGELRARYLVGCDGGRSAVRKRAGIDFVGHDASVSYLIAELQLTEPQLGMRPGPRGANGIGPVDSHYRVVLVEPEVRTGDPTLDELRAALIAVYGSDFAARDPIWLSRFSDATRQATTYRAGRVLLAGDAAHIHSPTGGQGLNLGLQDAVNLGWKLARAVAGAPPALLDTYTAERHPVAARALKLTMAATALARGDDRTAALRDVVGDLMRDARVRYAGMLSGLDIHYDLGAGHPLLGRRMPDLDLGGHRVYQLLHTAQPVLLDLATYRAPLELPVLGVVPTPAAVLIRPDGHVAWVGDGTDAGLAEARARWSF